MVFANSKGSVEPLQFAHVSGRSKRNFSQRASLFNISKRPACALKDWFDWPSEDLFFSRDTAHVTTARAYIRLSVNAFWQGPSLFAWENITYYREYESQGENLPSDMCAQWKLRSACAYAVFFVHIKKLHSLAIWNAPGDDSDQIWVRWAHVCEDT